MLTIAQKLDYIPALASVALTFVWAVLTLAFRAPEYPTHWLLHIGYAVFRKLTSRLSVAQMQYVFCWRRSSYLLTSLDMSSLQATSCTTAISALCDRSP